MYYWVGELTKTIECCFLWANKAILSYLSQVLTQKVSNFQIFNFLRRLWFWYSKLINIPPTNHFCIPSLNVIRNNTQLHITITIEPKVTLWICPLPEGKTLNSLLIVKIGWLSPLALSYLQQRPYCIHSDRYHNSYWYHHTSNKDCILFHSPENRSLWNTTSYNTLYNLKAWVNL